MIVYDFVTFKIAKTLENTGKIQHFQGFLGFFNLAERKGFEPYKNVEFSRGLGVVD